MKNGQTQGFLMTLEIKDIDDNFIYTWLFCFYKAPAKETENSHFLCPTSKQITYL